MKLILFLLLGLVPFLTFGQGNSNKRYLISKDTLHFKSKLTTNPQLKSLNFESELLYRSLKKDKIHFETSAPILDLSDLQFNLALKERHKAYLWSFDIGLVKSNQDSIRPKINQLASDLVDISWSKPGDHQIIWEDLLEDHLILKEDYDLFLVSSLYGDLNCQADPEKFFTMEQHWPYAAGLTLGTAAFVSGSVIRRNAQKQYDEYLKIWGDGGSLELADPEISAAEMNKQDGENLLIAGGAILLIQGYLLGKRYLKVRRQQKDYRFYCSQNTLQIQPALVLVDHPIYKQSFPIPGLQLSYQF